MTTAVHPQVLLVERQDNIAIVRLNRPADANAINAELHSALTGVWDELVADETLRAVVVTGAGDAFSAGGDMNWLVEVGSHAGVRRNALTEARTLVDRMLACPLPIIAAVNGPRSTVVSGPAEAVDRITRALAARGAKVAPLPVSHAFHSPLMAPAQAAFRDIAGAITPREAKIPLVSTVHGGVVVGTDMDADYWAAQLTSTVRSADAIATATRQAAPTHLVELGPRPTLVALAHRCGIAAQTRTLSTCRGPDDDGAGFARIAAQLYADGVTIRFDNLYRDESRTLKRLPPYAFCDQTRFWRELGTAPTALHATAPSPLPDADTAAVSHSEPDVSADRDAVLAAVHQHIADIGGYTTDEIHPNARLGEDLGYDSLLLVGLIDRLRNEYPQLQDAPIDELLPVITKVDDLQRYVADRVAGKKVTA